MKFALVALIGVASAQDGEASLCETTDDCAANFDAIYAEWENQDEPNPDAEPRQGEQECANITVAGVDEDSGEEFSIDTGACVNNEACAGFTGDENGNTITVLNCDAPGEGSAAKLAAGVVAMVAAAYAM